MDLISLITSATPVTAGPRPDMAMQTAADIDARHTATFGIDPASPAAGAAAQAAPVDGTFDSALANALQAVEASQQVSDDLAVSAAAGDPNVDVHDVLVAQTKAQLDIQLAVTMRNAAVNAFNEIIRTPL